MLADCSGDEKCQQWTAKIQSIGYDGESGRMAGPVRAPETAPAAQRVPVAPTPRSAGWTSFREGAGRAGAARPLPRRRSQGP